MEDQIIKGTNAKSPYGFYSWVGSWVAAWAVISLLITKDPYTTKISLSMFFLFVFMKVTKHFFKSGKISTPKNHSVLHILESLKIIVPRCNQEGTD